MKLSAEEVVVFLHTSIDKLSVLDFLDKRCRALEIADAEYVSALDNLLKDGVNYPRLKPGACKRLRGTKQ